MELTLSAFLVGHAISNYLLCFGLKPIPSELIFWIKKAEIPIHESNK